VFVPCSEPGANRQVSIHRHYIHGQEREKRKEPDSRQIEAPAFRSGSWNLGLTSGPEEATISLPFRQEVKAYGGVGLQRRKLMGPNRLGVPTRVRLDPYLVLSVILVQNYQNSSTMQVT